MGPTPSEQRVLAAAREWAAERTPEDTPAKALMVAVARCYPNDFLGKEHCTCGESADCDECATTAEIQAFIDKIERELQSAKTV